MLPIEHLSVVHSMCTSCYISGSVWLYYIPFIANQVFWYHVTLSNIQTAIHVSFFFTAIRTTIPSDQTQQFVIQNCCA